MTTEVAEHSWSKYFDFGTFDFEVLLVNHGCTHFLLPFFKFLIMTKGFSLRLV